MDTMIYHSCKSDVALTQLQNSAKIWHFPNIKHIISAVYSIAVSLCNSVMIPSKTLSVHVTAKSKCHADYCSMDTPSSTIYTSCFLCNGDCSKKNLLYFGDSEKLWQRDKQTFFTCCGPWVRTGESVKRRSEARHMSGFLQYECCLEISTWCELARHMHF